MVRSENLGEDNVKKPYRKPKRSAGEGATREVSSQVPAADMALESGCSVAESSAETAPALATEVSVPSTVKPATHSEITLRLSANLLRKIKAQAQEEGISSEDLIQEFLAESVTLRAFEIMEKKAQMKLGGQGGQRQQQNQPLRRNNNNNKGGNRMSQSRYQNIMDDKANFLEYVRTQERNRR